MRSPAVLVLLTVKVTDCAVEPISNCGVGLSALTENLFVACANVLIAAAIIRRQGKNIRFMSDPTQR